MTKKPVPPAHLSDEAKRLWRRLYADSEMDGPALLLLDSIAESFDRMRQAQALIAKDGIVIEQVTAAGNVRRVTNPACAVERDSKASLMRGWRLMGWDQAGPDSK